jgi:spore coat polysaccharide biosynthesis protein SpsF
MVKVKKKSKTGIIIFSRMSSSRLPGKALIQVNNKTLIEHVLDRALLIGDYEVILATSKEKSDDCLVDYVSKKYNQVSIFRGDLDDVRERAIDACNFYGLNAFARICGDRPLFDIEIVQQLIDIREKSNCDLATNCLTKTYPAGLTAEVVSLKALIRSRIFDVPGCREHITKSFYDNPRIFRIYEKISEMSLDIRQSLTVDIQQDIDKIEFILKNTQSNMSIIENIKCASIWSKKNQD